MRKAKHPPRRGGNAAKTAGNFDSGIPPSCVSRTGVDFVILQTHLVSIFGRCEGLESRTSASHASVKTRKKKNPQQSDARSDKPSPCHDDGRAAKTDGRCSSLPPPSPLLPALEIRSIVHAPRCTSPRLSPKLAPVVLGAEEKVGSLAVDVACWIRARISVNEGSEGLEM